MRSARAPSPCENSVCSSTSSVSRDITAPTSDTAPSRLALRRSTVGARRVCIAGAKSATWRGENSGASARRWTRQSSPSAVSSPLPRPGRKHPKLQSVLAVVGGVVEKDPAHGGGIVSSAAQAQNRAADRDGLLEIRLRPRSRSGCAAGRRSARARRAACRAVAETGGQRAWRLWKRPAWRTPWNEDASEI